MSPGAEEIHQAVPSKIIGWLLSHHVANAFEPTWARLKQIVVLVKTSGR